jgi:small conductance mechanosensitive channel
MQKSEKLMNLLSLRIVIRQLSVAAVIFLAILLSFTGPVLFAQTSSLPPDAVTSDPEREVSIAPDVRDFEIADRLARILRASGWFEGLNVSVSEGIVFLDGQTATEEQKDWARQLALRTQSVVAVVNRMDVQPDISWDLTPTLREIENLTNRVQWFAPLLVVSLVILVLTWLLARGVSALARRSLRHRIVSPLLLQLVARVLAVPVIVVGLYIVLQVAGLTRLALTVLGGTGVIGIVLGLAFREIAENSLASILLSVRNPFRAGDTIEVGGHIGIVQNLNMRTTVLLTLDGNHVQIPNALVFKNVITNFSSNPNMRSDFKVGIGYDDSVLEAQDVIMQAMRAHPAVLNDPEPVALVDDLGASTVTLSVQYWVDGNAYSILKVRSAVMRQVKRALQDAGITMPDEAREIIFPNGVPIRRMGADNAKPPPKTPPRDTGKGDDATVTIGEGDLLSETADLKRQALGSSRPDEGENLLSPSNPDNTVSSNLALTASRPHE